MGKESACKAGDWGLIPWSGKSPGGGHSNPLQYSCLKNPMDSRARQATVHGVIRVGHDLAAKPPPPCPYFHSVNCPGFVFVGLFSFFLLLFSVVVSYLSSVLCLDSLFFFVCVSIIDFWFVVTTRL